MIVAVFTAVVFVGLGVLGWVIDRSVTVASRLDQAADRLFGPDPADRYTQARNALQRIHHRP